MANCATGLNRRLKRFATARITFLHAILDFIIDGYLAIVRTIEDAVLDMETQDARRVS